MPASGRGGSARGGTCLWSRGVSAPRGCLPLLLGGGGVSQHTMRQTPPSVNRILDVFDLQNVLQTELYTLKEVESEETKVHGSPTSEYPSVSDSLLYTRALDIPSIPRNVC